VYTIAICLTMYDMYRVGRRTDLSGIANGIRISHQDAGLKYREWDKDLDLWRAESSSYG
jgi:hypothetical protein